MIGVALKECKQIVHDTACESTSHGIPHIFKRENLIIKTFWILCTLAATGVCAWLVTKSVTDYLNYETVTVAQVIDEVPTLFPVVSICNKNPFTTNFSFQYVDQFFNDYDMEDLENQLAVSYTDTLNKVRYQLAVILRDKNVTDDQRKAMGLEMDDMLLMCLYNGRPCYSNDFFWYFDSFYGSCYSFNVGKNASGGTVPDRKSTKAGTQNGLQLELYIDDPTDIYSLSYTTGLHVIVHNKTEMPSYLNGVSASVGSYTNIAVSREFSSRMEQPYSQCVRDIDSYAKKSLAVKTILESDYAYTQSSCVNVCLQKYIVQNCSCYILEFPYWNASLSRACSNFTEVQCFSDAYAEFFISDESQNCYNECPLECESVTYLTSISTSNYPSTNYAERLLKNSFIQEKFENRTDVSIEELRNNLLAINVYYSKLNYKSYQESAKTQMVDLVSGIGGTIGLFLGVSFLSFIEIIDLFFHMGLAFYKAKPVSAIGSTTSTTPLPKF